MSRYWLESITEVAERIDRLEDIIFPEGVKMWISEYDDTYDINVFTESKEYLRDITIEQANKILDKYDTLR